MAVKKPDTTSGTELTMNARLLALVAALLIPASPILQAHHSFAAEYDSNKPVKVTGVVTKVEWTNPHIWFYVDVKDEQGKVTNWGFSAGPPGVLQRRGISRDAMKQGDVVVVEGFRARDGSNNASGGRVTFADGRSVFTASNEDRAPK
jgi:hypothetical protein